MALSPFDLIKKGAQSLIDSGKAFINAPDNLVQDLKTKAQEFVAPARGFPELNKPSTLTFQSKTGQQYNVPDVVGYAGRNVSPTDRALGLAKSATEIATGAGKLGANLLEKVPNYDQSYYGQLVNTVAKTKTGDLLADVIPKLEKFQVPSNVNQAKTMRLADIAGFLPVGSVKKASLLKNLTPELEQELIQLEVRKDALFNSPFAQTLKKKNNFAIFNKEGDIKNLADLKSGKQVKALEDVLANTGYADKPEQFITDFTKWNDTKKVIAQQEKDFYQRASKLPEQKVIQKTAQQYPFEPQLKKQGLLEQKIPFQKTETTVLPSERKISSLIDTIQKKQTDVKNKVAVLDYVRSPEKVFKKVGLENEFKGLMKADEAYKKELPQNINKITEWAKQVPPESNPRIFQYLDGQPVQLNDKELKVATEIKDWLKNWADRLNLPEDQRVSNYITHLFEQDFIKKEFDEDLAKIIAERIPGSVYDPFLQKRLGALGYKQDTWAALDAYVKRATRKVNLDPALEGINKKAYTMEKSVYDYVKKHLDLVNLRPTEFDTLIDNQIKQVLGYKLGQRPVAKISRLLRQNAFRGMIGGNVGSAFRNLSQGINTYAKLGEKYTTIGYYKTATQGFERLKELGVLGDDIITDRTINATKKTLEKLDKGLFALFDFAEKTNRASTFYGAEAKALAEGKTAEQAIEYAKKIVRDTQFLYSEIHTPVALQGDLRKVFLQFLSYPVKQSEFLVGLAKNKEYLALTRYILGGLLFTYTIGQTVGMKPSELIPFSGYLTGQQKFGTPPSLKLPVEVGKAIFNTPDQYGNQRDLNKKLSDIGDTLWGIIPAGVQMKKTLQGINLIKEGGSFKKSGDLQYVAPTSTAGKVQAILFGKYANENAQNYFKKEESNAQNEAKMQPIFDQVQQLKADGKTEEAQAVVDKLSDAEYEIYKTIKQKTTAANTLQNKKDIVPTYAKVQELNAQGKTAEAQAIVDGLTDEQYKAYTLVKKQVEKDKQASQGVKPTYDDGEPQTSGNILSTVTTYAKALGVDPLTAFNRIFTGQKIRYVTNGTIVVERLPLSQSQAIKGKSGQDMNAVKLDHTIPLELGGSNSESNLNLVPTAIWDSYTPVENALGKALRAGKISKNKAQELITKFKNGEITAQDVLDVVK